MKNDDRQDKHSTPTGTITLLLIYLIFIIALWGSAYLTMLSRGITQ